MHDLHDGAAQAGSSSFLPMNGHRGRSLLAQDNVPVNASYLFQEEPINFSVTTAKTRMSDQIWVRQELRGHEVGQGAALDSVEET